MKLAVMADIHSNLSALETVLHHMDQWQPDHILVGGDLINRGPQPRECVERVLARASLENWPLIKGNHEDYILSYRNEDWPTSGPAYDMIRPALWTFDQLDGYIEPLSMLSDEWESQIPDGTLIRMVHASMLGNRNGIFPDSTADELRKKIAPAPAVFLVGHTHRPLVRILDDTLIVNVGSVGQPFDGDTRAAYAQLTFANGRWNAEIIRLTYDSDLTDKLFYDTGFVSKNGEFVRLFLAEHREARPLIPGWYQSYEPLVTAGEMSIKDSIDRYLVEQEIEGV